MPKIHRIIKRYFHWYLDYLYVGFWQSYGFIFRTNPKKYQRQYDHNKPAIVILPGIYERWQFMQPIADLLDSKGYQIFIVESIGYNLRSIEDTSTRLDDFLDTIKLRDFVFVTHSKGGLIGKYYLANGKYKKKCRGLVAINAPFNGSIYANFLPFKSLRIFATNSKVIRSLTKITTYNQKIYSIFGDFDPHIPASSHLEGANNIKLENVAGHFKVIANKKVKQAVLTSLSKLSR